MRNVNPVIPDFYSAKTSNFMNRNQMMGPEDEDQMQQDRYYEYDEDGEKSA